MDATGTLHQIIVLGLVLWVLQKEISPLAQLKDCEKCML
jgi:hypothetical protein